MRSSNCSAPKPKLSSVVFNEETTPSTPLERAGELEDRI